MPLDFLSDFQDYDVIGGVTRSGRNSEGLNSKGITRELGIPKFIIIHRNLLTEVKTTNIIDQNRFKSKSLTLSRHQAAMFDDFTDFWPEMKV